MAFFRVSNGGTDLDELIGLVTIMSDRDATTTSLNNNAFSMSKNAYSQANVYIAGLGYTKLTANTSNIAVTLIYSDRTVEYSESINPVNFNSSKTIVAVTIRAWASSNTITFS